MSKMTAKCIAGESFVLGFITILAFGVFGCSAMLTCNIKLNNRLRCGKASTGELECTTIGCCYEKGSKSCFMKLAVDGSTARQHSCEIKNKAVEMCGYFGIDKRTCLNKGCCWNFRTSLFPLHRCYSPHKSNKTTPSSHNSGLDSTKLGNYLNLLHDNNLSEQSATESSSAPIIETTTEHENSSDIHSLLKSLGIKFEEDEVNELTTTTPAMLNVTEPSNAAVGNSTEDDAKDELIAMLQFEDEDNPKVKEFLNIFLQLQNTPAVDVDTSEICKRVNPISCCEEAPDSPCCEFANETSSSVKTKHSPTPRIVGGVPASGNLKKSMAYLTKNIFQSQFCGGTLINSHWVVTAAHCVLEYCDGEKLPDDIVVKFGKTFKKNNMWERRGVEERSVAKVICHRHRCKSKHNPRLNDIAMLLLSRPVQNTHSIAPAKLPNLGDEPDGKSDCITLGWGDTLHTAYQHRLKEVSVPYISNAECNLPQYRNCAVRACMMCAGDLGRDACEGDSGGPLFCRNTDGVYVLHGVYSWGRCGLQKNKPAVYTRVTYYQEWMANIISSTATLLQ